MTPRSKFGGVVADFAVTIFCTAVSGSATKYTRSVNVPPTSVATRISPAPVTAIAGRSALLEELARLNVRGEQRLEATTELLADRVVQPALVVARALPLG